jgi:Type II CAAX prenyl endopeptidase Rce1-like
MSYDLRSAVGWITAIAVVTSVFSYILSLIVSAALLSTTPLGGQLHVLTQQFVLWAFMLGIGLLANSLLVVAICLVIFAVCFLKAVSANGGFLSGLRSLTSGATPLGLPNWLSVMPLLASAILVIDLLLALLQDLFGVSTGMLPTSDPAILIPSLALAPIAEEIGFRISVLGLVAGILVAIKFGKSIAGGASIKTINQLAIFFSAFLSPGYAKERVGLPSIRTAGFRGISISEWIFLFITSLIFGLYHIIGGGGWGPGKFLTAALSGFVLGFVYLAYGAYADILLHWFFDLNFYAFYVFGQSTPFNGIFATFGDLATLGALALGVWAIIIGINWFAHRSQSPLPYSRL